MIFQKIMKYPILMIGILCMIIFIYFLKGNGFFDDHYNNLQASSCKSALIMLNKRKPKTWNAACKKKFMALVIDSEITRESYKTDLQYKGALYRELANSLVFISKNSANDSLSRVPWVTIRFESDRMDISARTKGEYLAQFATLKSPKMIAEHLKASVEVKERLK